MEGGSIWNVRASSMDSHFLSFKLQANAIGKNSKTVREFLEKNYTEGSREEAVKLTAKALMEVVESGSKNIEISVITREGVDVLTEADIEQLVTQIEEEKTPEEAAGRA